MNDKERVYHIFKHYDEMMQEIEILNNDETKSKDLLKKSIYMDLFQIGEHVNNLSDETKKKIEPRDLRGMVNIRNFIGHGYVVLDDSIIWDTISNDCPKLINRLHELF